MAMMHRITIGTAIALALLAAGTARAEDRDLCSDRPGKGTPACTLDEGKAQVEVSFGDYTHSRDADQIEDTTLIGDTLLRYGLTGDTEARIGWTAYGFDRTKDRATGDVDHSHGTGDVTLSVRHNFQNPDDNGTSIAVQPFVTLPVGGRAIGDGTWSAGVLVPFATDLAKDWRLQLDPEVDAAADEDRHGRHLAYSLVTGLTRSIGKTIQLSGEIFAQRDQDPSGHQTLASLDASAAYQSGKNRQFDISAYAGLTHATPRIELVAGVSQRF
jgi:hypothetical protein